MKFFIPTAKNEEQQQEVYESIRRFASETLAWDFSDKRVFSLRYRHNGVEALAQVGEHDIDGEIILAIFASVSYVVCTPNRGAFCGHPILVGRDDTSDVVYFE